MDEFIKAYLDKIEKLGEQIQCCVQGIYGYCAGMETVARDFPRQNENNAPTVQINGLNADNKNSTEIRL